MERLLLEALNKQGLVWLFSSIEDIEDVRREVEILYHLGGNPNITQMRGAYEDRMSVHLVMELCSGGELFDRIVSRGHYRWAAVGYVSRCKSIQYLGFFHV